MLVASALVLLAGCAGDPNTLPTPEPSRPSADRPTPSREPIDRRDASKDDHDIAALVYAFSREPSANHAPWAPQVIVLGVGGRARTTLSEQQAADPRRWRFAEPFADLSALDVLASSEGRYRVDLGPHPHCVGPVKPPPRVLDGRRQISITPRGALDSCLDWWAVDLFVDDAGRIEGVTLIRWEW